MTEKNEVAEHLATMSLATYAAWESFIQEAEAAGYVLVKAASLAAERRATVERIRERLLPPLISDDSPAWQRLTRAILDEEAARSPKGIEE